jgi:cobalamin transport system permease protein
MAVMVTVGAIVRSGVVVLILGVMFNAFVLAMVDLLVYFAQPEAAKAYTAWTSVSFQGVMDIATGTNRGGHLGLAVGMFCVKRLNPLLLGEAYAESIGKAAPRSRVRLR